MSPASHMVGRLRKLYGIVWDRMRSLNERSRHPSASGSPLGHSALIEQLEPRVLLSAATVVSIDRASPVGPVVEGPIVTYAVTFSEPVTGVTSADFLLALTGEVSASPTLIVSPDSGYNSVYSVTVSGISGNGTLWLNLVDSDSVLDQFGSHVDISSVTFQAPEDVTASGCLTDRVVADLNGDGKPDLVTADGALLGNGDGTFQTPTTSGL